MARPAGDVAPSQGQPVLYLLSLNGTFDRKTITVPFSPETLRIGRQTNKSTTPTTINGYFDSKVLSRQHAEIWAERNGKIWIRDIKSSNGTFVNGQRLSAENRESEPHELQTNDHLELGIDIVSEDQKSVVHHKVAAKVEHAGFLNASNSLLDMNFGDLDPANGALMRGGPHMNGMTFRGRTGSQASVGVANRMAPAANMGAQANGNGMPMQRGLWLTGPSTEAIVKKIHQEMRNAKLQSQDLLRTQEFLKTLLSKDDIRSHPPKTEEPSAAAAAAARPPLHMVNGNGMPFRADPKARFSGPPAPPPQQPLPEKPDVPSLKRGTAERAKLAAASNMASLPNITNTTNAPNTSPVRPDVVGQVLQLTDALNTAKREIDTQHVRVRELEIKLHKEQEARRSVEDLVRRLEESATTTAVPTPSATPTPYMNGSAKLNGLVPPALEEAFEPPPVLPVKALLNGTGLPSVNGVNGVNGLNGVHGLNGVNGVNGVNGINGMNGVNGLNGVHGINGVNGVKGLNGVHSSPDQSKPLGGAEGVGNGDKPRMDSIMLEMEGMRQQLEEFRKRAEKAEAERDADRITLAEMVKKIRQRDEDEEKLATSAAAAAAAAAVTMAAAAASPAATAAAAAATAGTRTAQTISRSFSRGSKRGSIGPLLFGEPDADSTAAANHNHNDNDNDNKNNNNTKSSGFEPNGTYGQLSGVAGLSQRRPPQDVADDASDSQSTLSRTNTITPATSSLTKVTQKQAVVQGIPYASMVGVVLLGMGLMAYLNGWQQQPPRLDR